jgi:adenine deaminase
VPTLPTLETSGAAFGTKELEQMLSWPETVAIGELDAYKVMAPKEPYRSFIKMAEEKKLCICGSINGFSGAQLQNCYSNGITDDHESVSAGEILEKLHYGSFIHVREGSTEHNLTDIITVAMQYPACYSQLCFCCDDKTPEDLYKNGHIDHNIRKAISLGLDTIWAYRMATYNTAVYYKQNQRFGLIAPGRRADIVLLDDLKTVSISDVFFNGQQVLKEKQILWWANKALPLPKSVYKTINVKRRLQKEDMLLVSDKTGRTKVRVVTIKPGQITTAIEEKFLPVVNGTIRADTEKNVQHFSLVERYQGKGKVVNAFVGGFGIIKGAFGSSVSHDHHHLVCVGVNPADMTAALNHIVEIGGGMVVVENGCITAELPLPLWGLLSEMNMEDTVAADIRVNQAVAALGCDFIAEASPFMVLSLMSLPVIPQAGFTDQGLIDTKNQRVLEVEIK